MNEDPYKRDEWIAQGSAQKDPWYKRIFRRRKWKTFADPSTDIKQLDDAKS
jgi:hypothetical protein